eukprot:6758710-Lingulodinium_polyedra.AAC.1
MEVHVPAQWRCLPGPFLFTALFVLWSCGFHFPPLSAPQSVRAQSWFQVPDHRFGSTSFP